MRVAVIGGSGFGDWREFEPAGDIRVSTPYGDEPVTILTGQLAGHDIAFLPRHGRGHTLPPHRINYRANVWALKQSSVGAVVSVATVGGISPAAGAGVLMLPDQLLDYTWGREHTYFDGVDGVVAHVDMSEPYTEPLRALLVEAARASDIEVVERGTYAVTQGPRFETPAEIGRLERDGADIVGMTGMPEAALARELQLAFAVVAVVVNPAAGKGAGEIAIERLREWQTAGRMRVACLLAATMPLIHDQEFNLAPPMRP